MAYPTVISDRVRRRKRRARKWAFARGFITFVVAFAVMLLSAWLGGDLRRRDHQASSAAPEPVQPVLAEPLAPPAQQTLASPIHHVSFRLDPVPAVREEFEVLSAEELASISQAHGVRPAP